MRSERGASAPRVFDGKLARRGFGFSREVDIPRSATGARKSDDAGCGAEPGLLLLGEGVDPEVDHDAGGDQQDDVHAVMAGEGPAADKIENARDRDDPCQPHRGIQNAFWQGRHRGTNLSKSKGGCGHAVLPSIRRPSDTFPAHPRRNPVLFRSAFWAGPPDRTSAVSGMCRWRKWAGRECVP